MAVSVEAKGSRGSSSAIQAALVIVLACALANLLFNAFANAAGWCYPYTSFLFRPLDRFADFFKLAFSYPGAQVHSAARYWGLSDLLEHHMSDVRRFEGTDVNHFHVPPVPTLLGLGA